ncbi:hypothetical protein QFC21_004344 [Naganishia friedmannii]|uniref:Uncharacterized protein n=1 Tax=Naganishia friedmannii TaxID=89922 RepID=A0ACC2VJB9_9TREE|nr:hypothetical protein QFC21_004344 [Naganishia friedmannii]
MSSLPISHVEPPPPPPPISSSNTLTTPETLLHLISKRTQSWGYLQSAHSSSVNERWFNTVHVTRSEMEHHLASSLGPTKLAQRTRTFLVLGMSVGNSVAAAAAQGKNVVELVKGVARVLDEWEAWNEGVTTNKGPGGVGTGVKNLLFRAAAPRLSSRKSTTTTTTTSENTFTDHLTTTPSTNNSEPHYIGNNAAYHPTPASSTITTTTASTTRGNNNNNHNTSTNHHPPSSSSSSTTNPPLLIPHIPFPVDYFETVITLCTLIRHLYTRTGELVLGTGSSTSTDIEAAGLGPGSGSASSTLPTSSPLGSSGYGAGRGVTWSSVLVEVITRMDGKLKKILILLTREIEHVARTRINEHLATLLRGLTSPSAAAATTPIRNSSTPITGGGGTARTTLSTGGPVVADGVAREPGIGLTTG